MKDEGMSGWHRAMSTVKELFSCAVDFCVLPYLKFVLYVSGWPEQIRGRFFRTLLYPPLNYHKTFTIQQRRRWWAFTTPSLFDKKMQI